MDRSVKRKELFSVFQKNDNLTLEKRKKTVVNHVLNLLNLNEDSESLVVYRLRVSFFNNINKLLKKIPKYKRNYKTFENTYADWLNKDISFNLKDTSSKALSKSCKFSIFIAPVYIFEFS